ncbi:MAG: RagB/SusD family nutrient uptake outer membrane protein [Bacteroidota bacterium]
MKKILYSFLMISGIYALNACTDLEEDLKDSFTEATEQEEGEETSATADGAFSKLLDGDAGTANHNNFFSIQEVSSDEAAIPAKGGDWFDGGIWVDMHRHEWKSTSEPLNNTWRGQYEAIGEANRALANSSLTPEEVAQVTVLRAYFYYRLLDTFGNVKIVTSPGVDAPQSNRTEVFNFVESEILAAINSGDLSQERGNVARINEYAAQGLLAKLYLNAEIYTGTARWQDALDAADEVINSGLYNLAANYGDVFSPTNTDNIEHIWIVPFDETTGENMNFGQMTLHYGSQATFNLQDQPWNGYTTLEEFYNSYEDGDARKENNFLVGPQVDTDGNPILDLAKESNDPEFQLVYTPEVNELFPNAIRQGGARLFKFNFKENQRPNMDNDYPILRYGDMLLIKAEATARLAGNWDDASAKMYVNMLRSRAGVADIATLTEDEFLAERGREMFMEVTRRQDLIRFGRWGAEWWEKPSHDNGNLILFPIPLDQINAAATTDNPLQQNPGY